MNQYVLPDLSYDYAALEPHISGEIMELHHSKHHATYVKGANDAVEQLQEACAAGDTSKINQITKNLAFNLGGHINHSIFWQNLSPEGGDKPVGETAEMLDQFFGGFDKFHTIWSAAAAGIQGAGWTILAYDTLGQRPIIAQLKDQESQLPATQVPLLMLDMWEHAYYLQYKNVKVDYVKAWWNVINWSDVEQRLVTAKGLKLV
ncbi:superoxide dismutase [Dermatophilus congolensis]|uniref:superoxide dismutase n=1 Tax=Dermatophilus congolensis TaxID=1863 RepID=UPI001AAF6E7C|nr:superoxide dismutase [Dermatophilus congolensis]MBO3130153.1 superoxide dismutase [Dermatophilus congolensis]MBO3131220.1 superoxide dismutase [Dermatophilus congolensis]MBO3134624.1 superoxide dismutase [Dermatophilus congolensis]MBO3136861.1 superoxide dismutase [Dermatophilus congolensis]MBO3139105.1 superoxide dismutase [Dermatophilus congolensis]